MSEKVISPIILAAGQSKRFGSDKLRHPLKYRDITKPIIFHSLSPWLAVFESINVVVRPDNLILINMLKDSEYSSRLNLIFAMDAAEGMSASLVSGIEANKQADGWLIGLSDMPFVQSSVILDSFKALKSGAMITLPVFNGERGHPVGFASHYLSQLKTLTGDKGARNIIASSPDKITFINSPDQGIRLDIDTVDNLANI